MRAYNLRFDLDLRADDLRLGLDLRVDDLGLDSVPAMFTYSCKDYYGGGSRPAYYRGRFKASVLTC